MPEDQETRTDPVYDALSKHQQAVVGWDLQAVAAELHRWGELFRLEFKLEIPLPALRLCPLRISRLGHYYCGFNEFGLQNEIAISTRHIEACMHQDRWWRVLGTLLHEQLHLWQQVHGKPGRRNYHNVQYQKKAEALGLLIDRYGHTDYAPNSRFMNLLQSHGVNVPSIQQPMTEPRGVGQSKLKKWSCGCTNVRVAVADFRAVCLKCNERFVLAD